MHTCMPLLGGSGLWVVLMCSDALHVPSCVLPLGRILVGLGCGRTSVGRLGSRRDRRHESGTVGLVDVVPRCFAADCLPLLLPAHMALPQGL